MLVPIILESQEDESIGTVVHPPSLHENYMGIRPEGKEAKIFYACETHMEELYLL